MEPTYLSIIDKDYQFRRNSILQWEAKHENTQVWNFYQRVLIGIFYTKKFRHGLYNLFKKILPVNSNIDFVLEFQHFLSYYVLDDGYFEVRYYINKYDEDTGCKAIISTKDNIESFPMVFISDDKNGSHNIQLLEDAFIKLLQYVTYKYQQEKYFESL